MTLAAKFLSLSPERRGLVFEQAAAGLAGHAVILVVDVNYPDRSATTILAGGSGE